MKLLIAAESHVPEFEEFFEEVEHIDIDNLSPEIIEGKSDVRADEDTVRKFDAAFLRLPPRNAIFGRVLIETMQELGVHTNYPSTAFFVMSKKNYLYYVLNERGLPAPRTVAVATEKAARNIEQELELPAVGRRFEDLEETESRKMYGIEEVKDFVQGSEYEEDVLLFHELKDGEKYRCLVVGDRVISVEDSSDGWRFSKDSLKYSNVSDEKKETVRETARAIGAPVAEVLMRGEQVFDLNPNPDLEMYTEVSGKNAYSMVADHLKEGP
ncbi:MAG: RimK family alpha-L-glutamate ligase [Candidatus Nanohaloarchaea archaeon]